MNNNYGLKLSGGHLMRIYHELAKRLKEGGWTVKRETKHEIWQHPNGSIFPLSKNHSSYDKALKDIEKLEKKKP